MAGSNDFTGQNIQDTYQRVLQLSSSGQVADGTGSLVPLLKVTASFAISASHEITFELSSSHAQTADTASFVSGLVGTNSGDVTLAGTPDYITISGQEITRNQIDLANDVTGILPSANLDADTAHLSTTQTFTGDKTFSGALTASEGLTVTGDISQSGNFDIFTGRDVSVGRHFVADGNIRSRAGFIKADSYISGSEFRTTGNITASGNISASGNNHTFGGLTFIGDTTNEALGNSMLTVAKGSGVNIKLYSTHAGTNRDVGFHMSASSNGQEYSIGLARERNTFYIAPSSVQSGPENTVFEIDAIGNITASGNISASGTIIGNALTLSGLSNQGSEATAVVIDGSDIVGTRELGSNAFTSTTIGTMTNALTVDNATLELDSGTTFDGSAAKTISVKDGGIDSDALAANIAVTELSASAISGTLETVAQPNITSVGTLSSLTVSGDITANGNIDGDGSTDITNINSIEIGDDIIHDGDPDTKISFANDNITTSVGGSFYITLSGTNQLITLGKDTSITGDASITGNVSASNISASGHISGSVANFGGTRISAGGVKLKNLTSIKSFDNTGTERVLAAVNNDEVLLGSLALPTFVRGTNIFLGNNTDPLGAPVTASVFSASGDLIGGGLNINGTTTFNDGNITNVGIIDVDQVRADASTSTIITLGADAITNTVGGANVTEFTNTSITLGTTANMHVTASGNISASLISKIQAGSGSFHILQGDTTQDSALDVEGSITTSVGIKTANLVLTNLSNQGSEATAVVIDGSNIVGTRELGSNAFTSTTVGTTTNALTVDNATLQLNSGTTFDGSAARTISIKDGGVDSDALAADIAVTTLIATNITASGISASGNFVGSRQFNLPEATGTTQGDIIYHGDAGGTFAEGKLHYLRSNGNWELADKDAAGESGPHLLAFALGAAPSNGMLLRGMFRYGSDLGTVGDVLYVGDSGVPTNDVSGFSNPDIIRIIGYLLESTNGTIWFNPDNTFIKKA